MGKVHGSLARAGKVKSQCPKVAKQEKKKPVVGRAKKRIIYKYVEVFLYNDYVTVRHTSTTLNSPLNAKYNNL
ncbi:unnamed protein product [Umbelopsis ramanniana]